MIVFYGWSPPKSIPGWHPAQVNNAWEHPALKSKILLGTDGQMRCVSFVADPEYSRAQTLAPLLDDRQLMISLYSAVIPVLPVLERVSFTKR